MSLVFILFNLIKITVESSVDNDMLNNSLVETSQANNITRKRKFLNYETPEEFQFGTAHDIPKFDKYKAIESKRNAFLDFKKILKRLDEQSEPKKILYNEQLQESVYKCIDFFHKALPDAFKKKQINVSCLEGFITFSLIDVLNYYELEYDLFLFDPDYEFTIIKGLVIDYKQGNLTQAEVLSLMHKTLIILCSREHFFSAQYTKFIQIFGKRMLKRTEIVYDTEIFEQDEINRKLTIIRSFASIFDFIEPFAI